MQAARKPDRLLSLDRARGVAILLMLIAHLGPGVLSRLPISATMSDLVLLLGRAATTAFVVVFGLTCGFVYGPRIAQAPAQALRRAGRRSLLVLAAALVVVPFRWAHWLPTPADGGHEVWPLIFVGYSVLVYYAIGVLLLPLLVWLCVAGRQARTGVLIAVGLAVFLLGDVTQRSWWDPADGLGGVEYLRMVLCSGPYPVLQTTGYALVAAAVGLRLARAHAAGQLRAFLPLSLGAGLTAVAAALLIGTIEGTLSLAEMSSPTGRVPLRAWHVLLAGGATLLMLTGLLHRESGVPRGDAAGATTVRAASAGFAPLAGLGRAALPLYAGQSCLLPATALLHNALGLPTPAALAAAFVAYAAVAAYLIRPSAEAGRTPVTPPVPVPARRPARARRARGPVLVGPARTAHAT